MWVGLCTFWDPVVLSNKLSCEAGSFSCCHLNPHGVFNQWFEVLFPCAGALGLCSLFCSPFVPPRLSACKCETAGSASHHLLVSTSCSLQASCSLDHPGPQYSSWLGPPATVLPLVLSTQLHVSASLTGLDECVFFNSLVIGLPYSSIFCQFWLFFVFKFVVFLLLVVQGGTVCLPTPPSWPEA